MYYFVVARAGRGEVLTECPDPGDTIVARFYCTTENGGTRARLEVRGGDLTSARGGDYFVRFGAELVRSWLGPGEPGNDRWPEKVDWKPVAGPLELGKRNFSEECWRWYYYERQEGTAWRFAEVVGIDA